MANEEARTEAAYLRKSQADTAGLDVLDSATSREVREAAEVEPSSATLVYTGELLTLVTDSYGTKAYSYDIDGRLTDITGTGKYRSKTFAYTGEQLTSITVT
jgi:hypothetical protein